MGLLLLNICSQSHRQNGNGPFECWPSHRRTYAQT